MSELHYGKNVEWFLRELSAHEAGDIESAEIELIGENEQGVEGFTTIDITLLAEDAVSVISSLQQKLDAVLAERDKFAVQCAAAKIAVHYAKAAGFECTLNTPDVDAYLNEVRAEGAIAVRDALVVAEEGADLYAIATKIADQLRAGSNEGGA